MFSFFFLVVPSAPGRVVATRNTKTSVVVQWEKPKHEEDLYGYYIDYSVVGSNHWEPSNHKPIKYNRYWQYFCILGRFENCRIVLSQFTCWAMVLSWKVNVEWMWRKTACRLSALSFSDCRTGFCCLCPPPPPALFFLLSREKHLLTVPWLWVIKAGSRDMILYVLDMSKHKCLS